MKLRYLLLVFIFCFCFIVNCYAAPITYERGEEDLRIPDTVRVDNEVKEKILKTPSVDETQKIYDFADVLEEKQEKEIQKKLLKYNKETNIDSVIVITDDLIDFSLADYTYNFYDYNYFSKEGIILTIYVHEDIPKIFMGNTGGSGSDVFETYSTERSGDIIKYIYDKHMSDNNYYEICNDYINLTSEMYSKNKENVKIDESGKVVLDIPWFSIIIMSVALTFIIVVLSITKYGTNRKRKNTVVKDSINQSTMVVKLEYDKVVEKQE
ncbi:MAG: TPM domain-containing protein [Bacilli bacterium]|nr:TPM domain-containing protein [Bacilli bacterium]